MQVNLDHFSYTYLITVLQFRILPRYKQNEKNIQCLDKNKEFSLISVSLHNEETN